MKKQEHIGWTCAKWIETADGYTCSFEDCNTEDDAIKAGRKHLSEMKSCELAREYDIYKRFTEPF